MRDLHVLQKFKHNGYEFFVGYTYPVPVDLYEQAVRYGWGRDPFGTECPGHDPDAPVRAEVAPDSVELVPDPLTAPVRVQSPGGQ